MFGLPRVLVLVVVAFAVGAGSYFGSSQVPGQASSARSTKTVVLANRDVAVFRGVQCIANVEGGQPSLLCQRRPRSTARYETAIFRTGIYVFRMGNPDPVYSTP